MEHLREEWLCVDEGVVEGVMVERRGGKTRLNRT